MKGIYTLVTLLLLLSGCATTPVSIKDAKRAPGERVIAFQSEEAAKTGTLTVIRDEGFLGSGCYYALWVNQILAARLDVAEYARFYIEPGEVLLKVGIDPEGNGLCGLGQDQWTQRETLLKVGEQKTFRMTIGVNGELDIIRADMKN